jgi:hypothetical protein
MTARRRVVDLLLRIYPREWRREYGAELAELLVTSRIDVRAVVDVLWHGFRQRVRSDPAVLLGIAAMLGSLALLIANLVSPRPFGGWTTVLEPSAMTVPGVRVSAVVGDVFSILFVACGWWTYRRRRGTPSQAGWAAAAACLLAGVPVMLLGALLLLGVVDVSVVGPGHAAGGIHARLAFTYYSAGDHSVSPLAVMLFPLSRMPIAWLWGSLGGCIGRWT